MTKDFGMTTSERMSRPSPKRDAPHRGIPPVSGSYPTNPPPSDAAVDEVVAHAVRVGYQVIGENIRQGRTAADRLTAGDYGIRDVPGELTQLSLRLLQLTREMSSTAFDLIGAVLRDPTLQNAMRGSPPAPQAQHEAARPAAGAAVPLTYNIRGSRRAVGEPSTLRHPEQATSLTIAGLMSPNPALPPLKNISFSASPDGGGIAANIVVPDDQPAGTYSGVVCDGLTHKPLGTLTVQVMP